SASRASNWSWPRARPWPTHWPSPGCRAMAWRGLRSTANVWSRTCRCTRATVSSCSARCWPTRRTAGAAGPGCRPTAAAGAEIHRRGPAAGIFLAASLALFLGQVAETAHALGQFLVLLGEVLAIPLLQCVVLAPQREGLHLGLAAAVGALRGGVVPALVVERIGD